jgi:hypothetical protein
MQFLDLLYGGHGYNVKEVKAQRAINCKGEEIQMRLMQGEVQNRKRAQRELW